MAHKCTECHLGVYRPRSRRKRFDDGFVAWLLYEPRRYCDHCGHRYRTLDEQRHAMLEGMKPYLTARSKQVDDEVMAALVQ